MKIRPKHFAHCIIIAGVLSSFGCRIQTKHIGTTQPMVQMHAIAQDQEIHGTWVSKGNILQTGGDENQWVQMELVFGDEKIFFGRPYRDFAQGYASGDEISFLIEADGGQIVFSGNRLNPEEGGKFAFKPNPEYVEEITRFFEKEPDIWDLFRLAIFNVSAEYVGQLHSFGKSYNVDEVIRLRNFGVDAVYIKQLVERGAVYKVDEIIKLKNFGVPSDFPSKLQDAGYQLETDDLVKLKNFGVSSDYAREWKDAGFEFTADDLVKLRNFGVASEYGTTIKQVGMTLTAPEIIKLKNFGVTPTYLVELQPAGKYSVDEIVRLRNFGVRPDYLAAWSAAGYSLTVDQAVRLKNAGVSVEYATASNMEGRKKIDIESLIQLRNRGVTPETIRKLRE
ncbi:MAG: hypothetical protein ACO1QB_03535 [Verrucomicrobiales bacterium]